jgi:mono/diheme cytochrome c family protein
MKVKIKVKVAAAVIIGLAAMAVFHPALRARQTVEAAQAARSVWDGVYNEEQAKRGQELYAQECASCHEADLSGKDEVSPLTGAAFLANWSDLTVGDLFQRTRLTMPPNKTGQLSREKITDILSYVLKVNGFPAGKTEMEPKPESLKQIRIEATKPKDKSGSN